MDENNKDKIPKAIFKGTIKNDKKDLLISKGFPDKKSIKEKAIPIEKGRNIYGKLIRTPDNSIEIPVYRNSKVIVNKSIGIDNNTRLQLLRILEIDKEFPDAILGFNPPLFKEFISKTGDINTHVKINQEVKLKFKFKREINEKRIVKDLYFTSLNNMTVIIAKLDNNDFYPSYQLQDYDS